MSLVSYMCQTYRDDFEVLRRWTVRPQSFESARFSNIVVAWCIQRNRAGQNTVL